MAYIGRGTESISNVEVLDNLTFDGSSSYTLQKSSTNFVPSSANNLLISISGVVQQGNFSVSGSTITFDTAVSGSDTCDWILHYGIGLITTVADGTVTTAKLGGGLTVTHAVGSAGSPSITFDSDSNTGIFSPSADTLAFTEGGTEAMRIDNSGNVGIGTSSPSRKLHISTTAQVTSRFTSSNTKSLISIEDTNTTGENYVSVGSEGNNMILRAGGNESMRIDNQGSVLINNLATPHDQNVNAGFKVYGTGSGATVLGLVSIARYQGEPLILNRVNNDGRLIGLQGKGVTRGEIAVSGTVIQYTSYSDHRLKEDVQQISNSTESLKQLNPVNFAWIDGGVRMNGFLAHEVQSVVPEAVTGTHNEVDSDGNPVYQGIDQSKLVPLLTASLKEAIAKIEELETRIATLENN
jgi:hypothetical protein